MKKYLAALAEANLTKETVSRSIRTIIDDYEDIEATIAQEEESLSTLPEDQQEAIRLEIEKKKEILQNADDVLVTKIAKYAKNKDVYDANTKKLQQGRKKNGTSQQTAPVQPDPQPQPGGGQQQPDPVVINPDPVVNDTEPAPQQTQDTPDPTPVKPKKKNTWAVFLVGGLLAMGAALVGIELSNRDR